MSILIFEIGADGGSLYHGITLLYAIEQGEHTL